MVIGDDLMLLEAFWYSLAWTTQHESNCQKRKGYCGMCFTSTLTIFNDANVYRAVQWLTYPPRMPVEFETRTDWYDVWDTLKTMPRRLL